MSDAGTWDGWMARALDLARRGEGLTRPNPPVGALVLRDGDVVGEGWHRQAGGPHAERMALDRAGDRARDATLVVTLEPCSTTGRTPPCTEAIIEAGIRRVVGAVSDPNPAHAGRGWRILREAGIEVVTGAGEEPARRLLEPFAAVQRTGRPFVTLKIASTLDGRIADAAGQSKWITGDAAREQVQALRRRVDAVLVGAGTVRADNPSLRPRPDEGRRPLRAILAGCGELPPGSTVLTDAFAADTRVYVGEGSAAARCEALAAGGAGVVSLPHSDGRLDPADILHDLAHRGVLHVLCEGGACVAGLLLNAGLVDELHWYSAPLLLGDEGLPAVRGIARLLPEAVRLDLCETVQLGPDVFFRLRPKPEDA